MSSSWSARLFQRARTESAPAAVPVELTEAFFDMDKRQSITEAAVEASEQLFPERRMRRAWQQVVDVCYAASAAYLAATTRPDDDRGNRDAVRSGSDSFGAAREQLLAASRAVDEFYGAHRAHLEHAQALLSAVPSEAQQAAAAAGSAQRGLDAIDGRFADFPSVKGSGAMLRDAVAALDAALATNLPKQILDAAARLRQAAAAADEAVTRAPGQERLAAQSLASVTTRMAAISTRAAGLAPAFSSLLREFNAASSADLTDNERTSRRIIAEAAAELSEARATLSRGNPERASELTTGVRARLAKAEELVDMVTGRLVLLRSVRANPKAAENDVRFRLRDAQMLAVSSGAVREWASVLDAQVERIDRVVAQLGGRNPDYWGYVNGLDTVSTFIAGVVQRMRTESIDGPS